MARILPSRLRAGAHAALLLTAALAAACSLQELPDEETGMPVFTLDGLLEGQPLRLRAGLEDYYLQTSYQRDADAGIWIMQGAFAPDNCTSCPGKLEISFRDVRATAPGSGVDMPEALSPGVRPYYLADGQTGGFVYEVVFFNESPPDAAQYEWDFGDGALHQGPNPVHTYSDTALTEVQVCLEAVDASGCNTIVCSPVQLDPGGCSADFTYELFPGTNFVGFASSVSGTPPYRFRWSFGDGYGARLGNPGYTYAVPGRYTVCMTVTDATGCSRTVCKTISSDPSLCTYNFTYQVSRRGVADPLQGGRVRVRWTDAAGRVWDSALKPQPAESRFELLRQEPYRANLDGDPTRKVELALGCLLFSEEDTLRLEQVQAVTAVAYPD
ncbi:MAG: PKD domain-containing protein [Bacteroidia bacterium]|nr:PKD domain-containing protein [Bacteroidia bacterium]